MNDIFDSEILFKDDPERADYEAMFSWMKEGKI